MKYSIYGLWYVISFSSFFVRVNRYFTIFLYFTLSDEHMFKLYVFFERFIIFWNVYGLTTSLSDQS